MTGNWKLLYDSAAGTSHARSGAPCQDYALARDVPGAAIFVCADGAGSAPHAAAGARLACHGFLEAAAAAVESGLAVSSITEEIARNWFARARARLSMDACLCGRELRDYACTLLAAVVGARCAAFAQIGDGAIVFGEGDGYRTAFWPQTGEYANTTNFLTGPRYESQIDFRRLDASPDELALLTDGLQPLALHYATRSVHGPFFAPLFEALGRQEDADGLRGPLRRFLTSPAVAARTDDDVTLILATRRPLPT